MSAPERPAPDWIAVDWGTSNLRAWAMGPSGVIDEAASEDGMGGLSPDQFEGALLRLVDGWLTAGRCIPVIACGMVGSRQGWMEAPYRAVPCAPLDPAATVPVETRDPRIAVRLIPGLMQDRPADVMRGEETQIAGAIAMKPSFDGVLCHPGTHAKWARISAGEVVGFASCMTGELFALLSERSVLRHGMAGEGWDDVAFDEGVSDGIARPERLAATLFSLRAEGLLHGLAPAAAKARLSGLLIGAELAAMKGWWLGQDILVVGAEGLAATYARALALQGATPRLLPDEACVIAGLTAAHRKEPA